MTVRTNQKSPSTLRSGIEDEGLGCADRCGRREASAEPVPALRADSADQGKNIGQALVMSGTRMSSPGWLTSSFMSSNASQSWQPE